MLVRRLWRSGYFRLLLVAIAVAAGAAVVVSATHSSPSSAKRAAAERQRLRNLSEARARIRAERNRDPHVRRERARLRADQPPRFGQAARAWPPSRARQVALVRRVQAAITRDALARFRAGTLNARTQRTLCVHLVRPNVPKPPPPPLTATRAGYECTAITIALPATSRTHAAIIGFPFWARVNFRTGRYAFCKVNLQPSEGGIGGTLAYVPLAPVCDLAPREGPA